MADALAKRRRTGDDTNAASSIAMSLPIAPQLRAQGLSRREVEDELHKHREVTTPYGDMLQHFNLPTTDGKVHEVEIVNMCAMLWYLASKSDAGKEFLVKHLGSKVNNIAIYCDGVTPGNVLRPDEGRSFEAVYWTIMDLPAWFRSQKAVGWMILTCVPSKIVKNVTGGMSAIAAGVLKACFPEDVTVHNIHRTGILLQHSGAEVSIRCRFACWLADEKELKSVASCKGSSGNKPCVSCLNVVGRRIPGDDGNLVHVTCPDEAKFVPNTPATLAHMADDLAAKHGAIRKAESEKLETCYGLKYEPTAILFNSYLRDMVAFPDSLYSDWMHCLVASGGIAQYQCNCLLALLKSNGISLQDIDRFAQQVVMPKTWQKLPSTFFQDRFVPDAGSHMKAFASEMVTVIAILGMFIDSVIRPTRILMDHIACFDDLRSIVQCLRLADDVVQLVPQVKLLLKKHHEAYLALYPECAKPKLHYLKHAVDCIARFKCNLNCFAPERKHKEAKGTGSFCYNKLSKAITTRMLYELAECYSNAAIFEPIDIGRPLQIDVAALFNVGQHCTAIASAEASTAKGSLRAGDLAWIGTQLVKVLAFVKVVQQNITSYKALVVKFYRMPGQGWTVRTGPQHVVDVTELSGTMCYLISGDRMFV
jgi:hypothetical protein